MNAISIASSGMQAAYARFTQSAGRVAAAGIEDRIEPETARPVPPVSVTQELVTQRDAQLGYTANAKVIGVGDSMQEATIRLLG